MPELPPGRGAEPERAQLDVGPLGQGAMEVSGGPLHPADILLLPTGRSEGVRDIQEAERLRPATRAVPVGRETVVAHRVSIHDRRAGTSTSEVSTTAPMPMIASWPMEIRPGWFVKSRPENPIMVVMPPIATGSPAADRTCRIDPPRACR